MHISRLAGELSFKTQYDINNNEIRPLGQNSNTDTHFSMKHIFIGSPIATCFDKNMIIIRRLLYKKTENKAQCSYLRNLTDVSKCVLL
jgi:hypothetical protein